MDIENIQKQLKWLPPRWLAWIEKYLRRIPSVKSMIEKEYDGIMTQLEGTVKPYRQDFPSFARLPETGFDRGELIRQLEALKGREEARWKEGYASGAVYNGDDAFIDFLNRVYAQMLGAAEATDEICGTVTSGGTESILLAMKTYRDWARDQRGIRRPEIVAPATAHPAFDKAAQYFRIRMIRTPVGPDFRADVRAVERAIGHNTIAIIGSAPTFPHGMIDPIGELSELARRRGIGFHTDACLGGFVLPWAERLGYPVPPFDFRLPGVTSMSADTHKYGYAAKGTSVVLYHGPELRRYQYFTAVDWPGGLYFSPNMAGSRPGGLSAVCWAAMISMGEAGYLEATRRILETAAEIKKGIAEIPELHVLGDPLWIIAFASDSFDIYKVMDFMLTRKWSLNPLHKPSAVHIALTLRHAQEGVAERFVNDLRDAVEHVKAHPEEKGESAPVYGMAATLPLRGVVSEMLRRYADLLYKV